MSANPSQRNGRQPPSVAGTVVRGPGQAAVQSQPGSASVNLDDPALYLNRELTWLAFNRRILAEAQDERNPLLERVKFLAITGSNLDEFFMKRIGGLKQQAAAGIPQPTVDGRTPQQQITECFAWVRAFERDRLEVERRLLDLLAERDIRLLTWEQLSDDQRVAVDAAHPTIMASVLDACDSSEGMSWPRGLRTIESASDRRIRSSTKTMAIPNLRPCPSRAACSGV